MAILYGLSCFTPYISPATWWVMGFLALGFPVLLILFLIYIFAWFWINKRIFIVLLLMLMAGYKNIASTFALNIPQKFSIRKAPSNIRILCWNVEYLFATEKRKDSATSIHRRIIKHIKELNPDILFLQDFMDYSNNSAIISNLEEIRDSLGYKYFFCSNDYSYEYTWAKTNGGVIIFSKVPLNNCNKIVFSGRKMPESVITADVTINNITRRLITTHLQSMCLGFGKASGTDAAHIDDSSIVYSNSVFTKLKFFLPYHAMQANEVRNVIDQSPYSVIFSADMNEVPSSYAYHHIKKNLKDVFLMKGFGLGRTYYIISPTLRIDYLMVSPDIKVAQYKKDDIILSDHFPQVMDVEW